MGKFSVVLILSSVFLLFLNSSSFLSLDVRHCVDCLQSAPPPFPLLFKSLPAGECPLPRTNVTRTLLSRGRTILVRVITLKRITFLGNLFLIVPKQEVSYSEVLYSRSLCLILLSSSFSLHIIDTCLAWGTAHP